MLKAAERVRTRRGGGVFITQQKDRCVLISKLGFAQIRLEPGGVFDVAARPSDSGGESFQWKDFFHLLSLCT